MTALLSPARRLAAALDPVIRMRHAGITADPWQVEALHSEARRIQILASRQAGKTMTIATLALHIAEMTPGAEIVIGAVKQAQAAEMLRRAMQLYRVTGHWDGAEVERESILRVELANGSRISAVPGAASTVRSFSALAALIIDEAAYVPEDFFQAVFPMLAVSRGRIFLLSTANAKVGAFYRLWDTAPVWSRGMDDEESWHKIRVHWTDCPRITRAHIEAEGARFGDRYVKREYELEFLEEESAAFREEDIARLVSPEVLAWDL